LDLENLSKLQFSALILILTLEVEYDRPIKKNSKATHEKMRGSFVDIGGIVEYIFC
jgi:hypothetical protein